MRIAVLLSFVFMFAAQACATGLPLPRFACLRSGKVNMHVGPGGNFPISWLYTAQFMPVEIIAEFDTWRQIRDFQGTEGWVHQSLLSGKRHFVVVNQTQVLRDSPSQTGKTVAYVEPHVIGRVHECQGHWCKVEVKFEQENTSKVYKGWLPRQGIWGVYLHEIKM